MKNEMETRTENTIKLNNVDAVIERLKSQESDYEESFLTMVQGNTFGGVEISESNICNNSRFIVDLWD